MARITDQLSYRCPQCDEVDEVACDITMQIRYNVTFTEDGDIDLDRASDANAKASEEANGEGYWYCGNCYRHIFTGTKDEFVEFMLTACAGSKAAE